MLQKVHFNGFLLPQGRGVIAAASSSSTHLLVLNSDSYSPRVMKAVWDQCGWKACADGGANRLFDGLQSAPERGLFVPHFILGDLDSVRDDVAEFYRTRGTRIEHLEDQDDNDLDKSVAFLKSRIDIDIDCTREHSSDPAHESSLVVLGAFGGRMDQQMAVLSSLVRWQGVFGRVVLLGEGNCSYLLEPGYKHLIRLIDDDALVEGLTCGLIPINGPVDGITTEGLMWNLRNDRLELGVRISSSNSLQAELQQSSSTTSSSSSNSSNTSSSVRQVTVETMGGGKLLWTHEWKFKTGPTS